MQLSSRNILFSSHYVMLKWYYLINL